MSRRIKIVATGRPTLLLRPLLHPWVITLLVAGAVAGGTPFRITVVDSDGGWPVPLVELRTTHEVRFVTDNAGVIAFDLPELMGRETWFHVHGHGYTVPRDGFGYAGVRLTPTPGGQATVTVTRQLPARRLGRITGGGLFAESQQLGEHLDWTDQGILGCDSVQNVVHDGRLFWGWGDTILPRYPLGRFHMLAATTPLQPLSRFEPPVRLRYDYVVDGAGVPRNVAELPGKGPTWLSGYASVPDQAGRRHLVATYAKIEPPLTEYERGLCVWEPVAEKFQLFRKLWSKSATHPTPPPAPHGHPVTWKDATGKEWLLFGDPFPNLRCPATFEGWGDPGQWEPLTAQSTLSTWKPTAEAQGDDAQKLAPNPGALLDSKRQPDRVVPHRGAMAWNGYRKRWVAVFTQLNQGGKPSLLGEIWYAEADQPTGPWGNALKIVTHDQYSFYNPQLHPGWTPADSPILLFEGTYTHTFSGNPRPTPRHDYNQVLYRLDLDRLPLSPPPTMDANRPTND